MNEFKNVTESKNIVALPSVFNDIVDHDIRKPTVLTHFSRTLSTTEQRLLSFLIFHVQEAEVNSAGWHEVDIGTICKALGWDSNNRDPIYQGFWTLRQISIQWNIFGADKTAMVGDLSVLQGLVCRDPDKRGKPDKHMSQKDLEAGKIAFLFSTPLTKVIADPRVYGKIKLIMIAVLHRPKHAYAFYELVADSFSRDHSSNRKPQSTPTIVRFSLDSLIEYLGLTDSYYKDDWKNFKTRVLKPSLQAVSKYSDYEVSFSIYREGRKAGGIEFTIISKSEWQTLLPFKIVDPIKKALYERYRSNGNGKIIEVEYHDNEEKDNLRQILLNQGIDKNLTEKSVTEFGVEGVTDILAYVDSQVQLGDIKDKTKYLANALRKGIGIKTQDERDSTLKKQAISDSSSRLREIKSNIEKVKRAGNKTRKKDGSDWYNSLTTDQIAQHKETFEKHVEKEDVDSAIQTLFEENGWKATGIETYFEQWVIERKLKPKDSYYEQIAEEQGLNYSSLLQELENSKS